MKLRDVWNAVSLAAMLRCAESTSLPEPGTINLTVPKTSQHTDLDIKLGLDLITISLLTPL
jgi:hypothetical protein